MRKEREREKDENKSLTHERSRKTTEAEQNIKTEITINTKPQKDYEKKQFFQDDEMKSQHTHKGKNTFSFLASCRR